MVYGPVAFQRREGEEDGRDAEETAPAPSPQPRRHEQGRAAGPEAQQSQAHRKECEVVSLGHRVYSGQGDLQEQHRRGQRPEARVSHAQATHVTCCTPRRRPTSAYLPPPFLRPRLPLPVRGRKTWTWGGGAYAVTPALAREGLISGFESAAVRGSDRGGRTGR